MFPWWQYYFIFPLTAMPQIISISILFSRQQYFKYVPWRRHFKCFMWQTLHHIFHDSNAPHLFLDNNALHVPMTAMPHFFSLTTTLLMFPWQQCSISFSWQQCFTCSHDSNALHLFLGSNASHVFQDSSASHLRNPMAEMLHMFSMTALCHILHDTTNLLFPWKHHITFSIEALLQIFPMTATVQICSTKAILQMFSLTENTSHLFCNINSSHRHYYSNSIPIWCPSKYQQYCHDCNKALSKNDLEMKHDMQRTRNGYQKTYWYEVITVITNSKHMEQTTDMNI